MPLYDCMLLAKTSVKKEAIMNLVARLGKRIFQCNGVITDIKSFGTVQLGYGIKKLDGRHFQLAHCLPVKCSYHVKSGVLHDKIAFINFIDSPFSEASCARLIPISIGEVRKVEREWEIIKEDAYDEASNEYEVEGATIMATSGDVECVKDTDEVVTCGEKKESYKNEAISSLLSNYGLNSQLIPSFLPCLCSAFCGTLVAPLLNLRESNDNLLASYNGHNSSTSRQIFSCRTASHAVNLEHPLCFASAPCASTRTLRPRACALSLQLRSRALHSCGLAPTTSCTYPPVHPEPCAFTCALLVTIPRPALPRPASDLRVLQRCPVLLCYLLVHCTTSHLQAPRTPGPAPQEQLDPTSRSPGLHLKSKTPPQRSKSIFNSITSSNKAFAAYASSLMQTEKEPPSASDFPQPNRPSATGAPDADDNDGSTLLPQGTPVPKQRRPSSSLAYC
ncbi:hypothetical protein M5K25_004813 [Dendrobium thyrsiflorum]|uniref:Uncharacterized protein n=1 Tax=Dendrobium thyrsiflorum TaxID=117978 RepID=A0ABD0VMZ4_DENTH